MAVLMPPAIPPGDDPISFDAPYGVFADHAGRIVFVTNIVGEPALSAEFLGDFEYWEALATAYRWEREGYALAIHEWNPVKHDPDQLRSYELPFSDQSEITS